MLGAIENGSEDFRLIVCLDNVRDANTLLPIIQEHIEIGSEIHTDAWRAYSQLSSCGYIHKVVNHSDPHNRFLGLFSFYFMFLAADGTHTQSGILVASS